MKAISGTDQQAEVGEHVGVSQATVSRWRSGKEVPDKAPTVAALARAYKRNPLEAFVAAGMLDEAEAGAGLKKSSRDFLAKLRGQDEMRDTTAEMARTMKRGISATRQNKRPKPPPPTSVTRSTGA